MELADLRDVYAADGPFVTVYVDIDSTVPDAAERLEVRWKDLEREMERLEVDAATREALTAARGGHTGGGTRLLVAAQGQVLLRVSLPHAPEHDEVHVGTLPHLFPFVAAVVGTLPYLVVEADSKGADVTLVTGASDDATWEVQGDHQSQLHKVRGGALGNRRMQNRVEEFTRHNAGQVAKAVDDAAKQAGAKLIVGTGADEALRLVGEQLPEALQPMWVTVPGGRTPDGSEDLIAEHVEVEVARRSAEQQEALLARYAQETGQHDKASDGPAATVEALRRAQVEVLLLTEQPSQTPAFFGPDPTTLGLTHDEVTALGVATPRQAPLVDVLLRAAVGTAADVAVLAKGEQNGPSDGVGGLLRFSSIS